jgi:serine O-acetyltransferase
VKEKLKLKELILSDLMKYEKKTTFIVFLKSFFISHLGFRISTYYRLCNYLFYNNKGLYFVFFFVYRKLSRKYGIEIPPTTSIGSALFMPHPISIVINKNCVIGDNCHLHQNVTIGASGKFNNKKFPILHDNIYIGPGVIIFGDVVINNNCAIGAGTVVTKSFEQNAVIVGVAGKKISNNGTIGLI